MEIFHQLNQAQGLTIVVVTHSDEVAKFASRIISFRDGCIVGDTGAPPMEASGPNRKGQPLPEEVSP
jgi:putative ABC transport system ATP-binding protein